MRGCVAQSRSDRSKMSFSGQYLPAISTGNLDSLSRPKHYSPPQFTRTYAWKWWRRGDGVGIEGNGASNVYSKRSTTATNRDKIAAVQQMQLIVNQSPFVILTITLLHCYVLSFMDSEHFLSPFFQISAFPISYGVKYAYSFFINTHCTYLPT